MLDLLIRECKRLTRLSCDKEYQYREEHGVHFAMLALRAIEHTFTVENDVNGYFESGEDRLDFSIQMAQFDLDQLAEAIDSGYLERRLARRKEDAIAVLQPPVAISKTLRRAIYDRDDYQCVRCGDRFDITCDHIHPQSKGGPTILENLQTLCRPCNSRKGARVEPT